MRTTRIAMIHCANNATGSRRAAAALRMGAVVALLLLCSGPTAQAVDHTVGGPCGATIQTCIDTADPGDTVLVPAGSYNESLVLDKAVSLIGLAVPPSASVVSAAGLADRALLIKGATIDASVIIENLVFQDGVVTTADLILRDGGGILVFDGAQPTIRHILIQDNSTNFYGGGLAAAEGSPLTLLDVTFLNNTAVLAGGGAQFGDTATVTDCHFEGNESTGNVAGALRATGATHISGSTFVANATTGNGPHTIGHGGAVYAFEVDLTIENCHFELNHCDAEDCDGGALYISQSFETPLLSITNTNFIDNTAGRNGGGVNSALNTIVTGGTFDGNHASGASISFVDGGGGMNASRMLTVIGTTFTNNTSDEQGGGVVVGQGPAEFDGVTFNGNSALQGGGLASRGFLGTTLTNTDFINNTATEDGGGAWIELGGLAIEGGLFDGNDATTGNGGGLFIASGDLDAEGVDINSNLAGDSGAGAFLQAGNAVLTGLFFEDNESNGAEFVFTDGGGAIALANGNLDAESSDFFSNRATGGLGGAAVVIGETHLDGCTFGGNQSAVAGGAVYVTEFLTVVGACTFNNNDSDGGGGAVFAGGGVDIAGGLFQTNSALHSGGGLYVACGAGGCTADLSNVDFIGNTAAFSGGGAASFEPTTITDCLFQNNHSDGSGGGFGGSFDALTISGSTITGNTAVTNGGGVGCNGNVTLVDSYFQANIATGSGGGLSTSGQLFADATTEFLVNIATLDGGGVWANSGFNLTGTLFESNASLTGNGGGIAAPLGFGTSTGATFCDNGAVNGGGVYCFDAAMVSDSHFDGNQASGDGGGLFMRRDGNIAGSYFHHNSAAGNGGAMYRLAQSGVNGQLVIESSTISVNTAVLGSGGLFSAGKPVHITNATFSGNTSAADSGAVGIGMGDATLTNVTIANNTAPSATALAVAGEATLQWQNTLVEGDCTFGSVVLTASLGGNLESPGNTCGFIQATDQTDIMPAQLNLGPLVDNGGPTLTHAILPGSDAFNAGIYPCPELDQRGVPRDDGFCDVGAYESPPCPIDLTGDGVVAAQDLAIILGFWGPNPGHPADFTGDAIVGPADLAILLGAWGPCPQPVCPGTGDCCSSNGTPACNDADCCQCICSCDAFCCDTSWDGLCAGDGACGASNPAGPCATQCAQCLP